MKLFNAKYFALFLFAILPFGWVSCKKLVEIKPPSTSLVSTNVYTTSSSANAVLLGLYINLTGNSGGFVAYYNLYSGLQADEMDNYATANATPAQFYTNSLVSSNVPFWSELYTDVYTTNTAIENLGSAPIDTAVRRQLLGESYFMRGFLYFYITNMWGSAPLLTNPDYLANENAASSSSQAIYQQVISDLHEAAALLNDNFVGSDAVTLTNERVRPTSWAAHALLARVYQFTGNWSGAKTEADTVLSNTALFSLDSVNNIFLANSSEAIWQLQPTVTGYNSFDAVNLILTGPPSNSGQPYALHSSLYNGFAAGDERRSQWIDSIMTPLGTYYYAYKYKVNYNAPSVTEYMMVLRLAEQYLIRAEAEANGAGNGVSAAIADINQIRFRAGLPAYSGPNDNASVLNEIYKERQEELFLEWGFRWLDLKRLGTASSLLTGEKGITVTANDTLYPVPVTDIQIDPNLTQNPGYN